MASFSYDVRYNGVGVGPDLSKDVVDAINGANIEGLRDIPNDSRLIAKYQMWMSEYNIALVGIKSLPGKMFGTETARMSFAGTEKDILTAKSTLLKMVEGLELV